MTDLKLEIIEGPGAGTVVPLDRPVVIGRDASADLVIHDNQASRRHTRVTPNGAGAVVEDLESTNGTFVNHNEVHGPAVLVPGDELLVGVTVFKLRSPAQIAAQRSAVVAVPPALAVPAARPDFVKPVSAAAAGVPELDRLVDARTKMKARQAPLAIFILVALALVIYFGLQ